MPSTAVPGEHSPAYRTRLRETDTETLCQAVVSAIATAADLEPTDMDPLYDSVDLDAVQAVLEHAQDVAQESSTVVGFEVGDWKVYVYGDGRIDVCER